MVWLVPQLVTAFAFCYLFVLGGQLSPPIGGPFVVLKAAIFFTISGLGSVALWAYFRSDGRPTRGGGGDLTISPAQEGRSC